MDLNKNSKDGLLLLGIIKKMPNSTREAILDYAVKSLYTDYFTAAEAFDSLLHQHLIHYAVNKLEAEKTVGGKSVNRINITPEGEAVFEVLGNSLPEQFIDYLDRIVSADNKSKDLQAKYVMTGNLDYLVTLFEKSGRENIIFLELRVPSEAIAKTICHNWKTNATSIYTDILKIVTAEK